MISAAIELQRALWELLTNDKVVEAAFGDAKVQIYDKVPDAVMQAFLAGTSPTYVTLGEGSETYEITGEDDDENRTELTHHVLVFHVWSAQVGLLQAKAIALAIRAAIIGAFKKGTLELAANKLKTIDPVRLDYNRQPDGFTSHAGLVMSALTQPET